MGCNACSVRAGCAILDFIMLIDSLSSHLLAAPWLRPMLDKLAAGEDAALAVAGSVRPFAVASLFARTPRPMAVVVSGAEAAEKFGYDIVNVRPWAHAGGSFATTVWEHLEQPAAVEHIKAKAGMDIGATLIGMHLKDVAVPVRLSLNRIGEAVLICARTRPRFIGGERARYQEELK